MEGPTVSDVFVDKGGGKLHPSALSRKMQHSTELPWQ